MPQFIQAALCWPPTGGVTEYVTGPVTWSWASARAAGPLWLPCGHPVVTYSTTPGMPDAFGTGCAATGVVADGLPEREVLRLAAVVEREWEHPLAEAGVEVVMLTGRFSVGLTALTIFDSVLVWLTWREYESKRALRRPARTASE